MRTAVFLIPQVRVSRLREKRLGFMARKLHFSQVRNGRGRCSGSRDGPSRPGTRGSLPAGATYPELPSATVLQPRGGACEVLPSLRPGLHSSPIPKEQTGPPSGLGTGRRPLRERSSRTPERVPAEPSGSVPCLPIPGPRKVLSLSRCSPQVLRPLGQNRAGPVNPWPRCFSLLPMSSCLKGRGCWVGKAAQDH